MPNLEHLKKQAKLYLKQHRDQYYPVAAAIRTVLPRYGHLDDSQILNASFKLADAQELVARKSGFESWQALKKGLQTMSDHSDNPVSKPFLVLAEPQLFVSDIHKSCDFYVNRLGFTLGFLYGEPPFYGQVYRNSARLNLRHVDRLPFDRDQLAQEDLLSATIVVEEIKALFLEYQEKGILFHQSLRTEPWGARTFIVADPDGNLIAFSG